MDRDLVRRFAKFSKFGTRTILNFCLGSLGTWQHQLLVIIKAYTSPLKWSSESNISIFQLGYSSIYFHVVLYHRPFNSSTLAKGLSVLINFSSSPWLSSFSPPYFAASLKIVFDLKTVSFAFQRYFSYVNPFLTNVLFT